MFHLGECAARYGFDTDDIIGLQFDVFSLGFNTKLPKKIFTVKSHTLDDTISKKTASKLKEIFQVIPLTMNPDDYGNKLVIKDNSTLINSENSFDNFIEVANLYNDNNNKISPNCVFYIKEDSDGVKYIIALDNLEKKVCVVSIYFTTGKLIERYVDKAISEDLFTRSSKNVICYVDMRLKSIVNTVIKTTFNCVSPKKLGKVLGSYLGYNTRFGTIDLETYNNIDKPEVYAIGFYTRYVEDPLRYFYVDNVTLSGRKTNPSDLIIEVIDTILTSKYDRRT